MYLYLRVFSMILLFKSLSFLVVVDILYIFSVERSSLVDNSGIL